MSDLDFSKIDLTCMRNIDGNLPDGCQDRIIEPALNYGELALAFTAVVAFTLLAVFAIRKLNILSKAKGNRQVIAGAFSGWAIWCFAVFSYANMFDTDVDYFIWFTLPPIFVLLVFLWRRTFVVLNSHKRRQSD